MPYIHFTQEQKDLAARTDLEVFLWSRGEKLLPSGRDKRLSGDHSVTIHGNYWFDHATHEGGNAISFVQRFYHLGYADAVSLLLCNGQVYGTISGHPLPGAATGSRAAPGRTQACGADHRSAKDVAPPVQRQAQRGGRIAGAVPAEQPRGSTGTDQAAASDGQPW